MAALVGNFLFVSNMRNQAALPSVLQEAVGKDSEHSGCAICPLYGWPASAEGIVPSEETLGKTVQEVKPTLSGVLI